MPAISEVHCRLFHVPLDEVLVDAKHGDHTHFELVTATVALDDGTSGTGYTYTGGKGGHAIRAMVRHDLAPMLIGTGCERRSRISTISMQWHIHYVGRGGLRPSRSRRSTSRFGIFGAKPRAGRWPRWQGARPTDAEDLLRRDRPRLPTCPNCSTACGAYLDRGFNAVKIKVGRPEGDDSGSRRCRAGPDRAGHRLHGRCQLCLVRGAGHRRGARVHTL